MGSSSHEELASEEEREPSMDVQKGGSDVGAHLYVRSKLLRLCWTPDLHHLFVHVVKCLGGQKNEGEGDPNSSGPGMALASSDFRMRPLGFPYCEFERTAAAAHQMLRYFRERRDTKAGLSSISTNPMPVLNNMAACQAEYWQPLLGCPYHAVNDNLTLLNTTQNPSIHKPPTAEATGIENCNLQAPCSVNTMKSSSEFPVREEMAHITIPEASSDCVLQADDARAEEKLQLRQQYARGLHSIAF